MASVNDFEKQSLGHICPAPDGEYSPDKVYKFLNAVTYQGGSYLAKKNDLQGVAPTANQSDDNWFCMAISGQVTPDYLAAHDRVMNAARQTELDRAAVELSEQNVSGMETNVEQMQADVQTNADQVARDKDSAAGYAQAAEASRQAAGTSEQNVAALVNGFDSHVAQKSTEATGTIETARQQAVSVVQQQGAESAQGVIDDTEAYFDEKKAAALSEISDKTTEVVKSVTDEGTKQIGLVDAAGAAQVAAVTQEGTDQIANIQMEAESYVKREDANKLAFKGQAEGRSHHVEDSTDWGFLGMQGYGESTQVQTTGAQLQSFVDNTVNNYGITFTVAGETISLKGTSTFSGGRSNFTLPATTLPAGTYALSLSESINAVLVVTNTADNSAIKSTQKAVNFTLAEETNISLGFNVESGGTYNISKLRIMLNTGETALPWEPYTGGAPSPSPACPQEIESKCEARQLLDESTIVQGMIHGVTGNNDGSSKFVSTDFIPVTPGDYIISGINITPHFNVVVPYDANKNILPDQTISVPRATGIFTVPEGVAYIRIRFNSATGITDPITPDELRSKKPMINAGTIPGAWAPYGKYGLETVVEAENLCNPQAILDAGFVLQEDGSYFINKANTPYLKNLWENPGITGQLYISYDTKHVLYNGKSGIAIYVLYKDGSQESAGTPSSESWVHTDFVTRQGKEVESIYFAYATSSASSYLRNVMISTAQSDYVPYTAQTLHTYLDMPLRGIPVSSGGNATIDGQQYIADYRDWERGKHIQRVRELVLDGSESYTLQSINDNGIANFVYTLPAEGAVIRGVLKNLCNMFRWDSNGIANVSEECYFNDATKVYFRIKSSTASTVEEFKAFVAQNNIQLQYVLAEPIETDIPPEELAAYRRLHAYHGTTNISNSDDVYTAVEYARDPDTYLNNKLAEISAAIIGG